MDSILGEEKGEMNRIIKVVAIALLVAMVFPLVVAADEPPPPEGPSIESPMLVPLGGFEGFEFAPPEGPSIESAVLVPQESFEGFEFPPSGWSVKRTNANQTWRQLGWPFPFYSGTRAAYVLPDPGLQREVLLTPQFYAPYVTVVFSSLTMSSATCQPDNNVCDLEVWFVKGAWGGGDDIGPLTVDSLWVADNTWYRAAAAISLEPTINTPIRIGFRYVGQAGAPIAIDDVTVIASPILNKNYSFEYGGTQFGWTRQNLATKDKRDSSQHFHLNWSFKMVGSSANKSLLQTMNYSGHGSEYLVLSGCSMSQNAKAGRPYQVVATVHHQDGSTESHKIKFSSGTHSWECKAAAILTKEPYDRIDLEIRYWNQGGKAWFDYVSLVGF